MGNKHMRPPGKRTTLEKEVNVRVRPEEKLKKIMSDEEVSVLLQNPSPDPYDMVNRWKSNIPAYIKDGLNYPKTLSTQQRDFFHKLSKLVNCKIRVGMAKNDPRMGKKLGITDEDRLWASKWGISIMGGQGTGKDTAAALSMIWFENLMPMAQGMITAPVYDTIKNVVLAEIFKILNMRDDEGKFSCPMRNIFELNSERFFLKEQKGKAHFMEARTIRKTADEQDQAETLAGRHENYFMYYVTEASGVPDPVFKPIEGSMTQICNFALLTFNPTKRTGYAYNTHFGPSMMTDPWIQLRWNAEESEIVSPESIEKMAKRYGKDSDPYRVRVLGLPPTSDSGSLIPWEWCIDATEREFIVEEKNPVILGVDVGGGGDPSVILARKGPVVLAIRRTNVVYSDQIGDLVLEMAKLYQPKFIYIDSIGIGHGVLSYLRGYPGVRGVKVSERTARKDKFDRLRDELWWTVRGEFETGNIQIPKDTDFVSELSCFKYRDDTGVIKVESKRDLKARGIDSPNTGDALMLTYFNNAMIQGQLMKRNGGDKYRSPRPCGPKNGWMIAR